MEAEITNNKTALIAHDVSPVQGSEAGNAWTIIKELERQGIAVDVYCAETNQLRTASYQRQIERCGLKFRNVRFVFVPYNQWISFSARTIGLLFGFGSPTGNPLVYSIAYGYWLRNVEHQLAKRNYEVVHLLNHISVKWTFSKNFLKQNTSKLIWGPVSGCATIPEKFFRNMDVVRDIQIATKNFLIKRTVESRNFKRMVEAVRKAFAVSREDYNAIAAINTRTEYQVDVLSTQNSPTVRRISSGETLRVIYVGRLHWLKCPLVAIKAVEGISLVSLTIVGEGPELRKCKKYCEQRQITNVRFCGQVTKSELNRIYRESHVIIHPSVREAAASVLIEAMETGLPVVAHNAFGIAELVERFNCGIAISIENEIYSAKMFKNALVSILEEPAALEQLSIGAIDASQMNMVETFVKKLRDEYR